MPSPSTASTKPQVRPWSLSTVPHYLGAYGTPESRTAYERLLGEWLANGRRAPVGPEISITVEELMAAYWDHVELHYRRADGSPTSEVDSIRHALMPVRARYAESAVDDFEPLAPKAVRQEMNESGYVSKSIKLRIGCIKRMFRWGVENELAFASILSSTHSVLPGCSFRARPPEMSAYSIHRRILMASVST